MASEHIVQKKILYFDTNCLYFAFDEEEGKQEKTSSGLSPKKIYRFFESLPSDPNLEWYPYFSTTTMAEYLVAQRNSVEKLSNFFNFITSKPVFFSRSNLFSINYQELERLSQMGEKELHKRLSHGFLENKIKNEAQFLFVLFANLFGAFIGSVFAYNNNINISNKQRLDAENAFKFAEIRSQLITRNHLEQVLWSFYNQPRGRKDESVFQDCLYWLFQEFSKNYNDSRARCW